MSDDRQILYKPDILEKGKEIVSFDTMMEVCEKNENFEYIDEQVNGITTRSFTHRLNYFDSFLDEGSRNFAGAVYNLETKELIALPFYVFFNFGQSSAVNEDIISKWKMKNVYEKVDGSLIYFVSVNGKTFWRTKRYYKTDNTKLAEIIINKNPFILDFANDLLGQGYTPLFELISPRNRLVVNYDFEDLCFLGVRNIKNGEIHMADLDILPNTSKLSSILTVYPIYDEFSSYKDIVYDCVLNRFERNDIREGYTVIYDNGDMLKFKRPQYLELYTLNDYVCSDVNIVKSIFDNTVDELLSEYSFNKFIVKFIKNIIDCVNDTYGRTLSTAKNFWRENQGLERKDYVSKAKKDLSDIVFPIAMEYYTYKEYANFSRYKTSYLANRIWRSSSNYEGIEITQGQVLFDI